jgi:hypothetical protein
MMVDTYIDMIDRSHLDDVIAAWISSLALFV